MACPPILPAFDAITELRTAARLRDILMYGRGQGKQFPTGGFNYGLRVELPKDACERLQ